MKSLPAKRPLPSSARELAERLEAAAEAGDLALVQSLAAQVSEVVREQQVTIDQIGHSGRLLDLGRMSAALVHELRQPLLGIKAFSQMLVDKAEDPRYVRTKAQGIQNQAVRMQALIERARQYSKTSDSALELCDVNRAVEVAIALLTPRIRASRAHVHANLADGAPSVQGDRIGLQQIMINLISNAFEAVGEGGCVKVGTAFDRDSVTCTVADNGPGIPASFKANLFRPFATSKVDGTGLGLYVSRDVATRMGASLDLVDSEEGATFELRLPLGAS